MTCAALLVSAKVFFDTASESVLADSLAAEMLPFFLGLIGVGGFLMFGAMTLVSISKLFDGKSQVMFSPEGIEDKRLGCGLIEWSEIEAVLVMETKYAQWLSIVLKSPEKFYGKLSSFQIFLRKLNGQSGVNNFRVRFTDLDAPIETAWRYIEEKIIKTAADDLHELSEPEAVATGNFVKVKGKRQN